jgi:hypothetical protein
MTETKYTNERQKSRCQKLVAHKWMKGMIDVGDCVSELWLPFACFCLCHDAIVIGTGANFTNSVMKSTTKRITGGCGLGPVKHRNHSSQNGGD